jgi:hypothetical protein
LEFLAYVRVVGQMPEQNSFPYDCARDVKGRGEALIQHGVFCFGIADMVFESGSIQQKFAVSNDNVEKGLLLRVFERK